MSLKTRLDKVEIPVVTAYEDEANTYSATQTFDSAIQLGVSSTPASNGQFGYNGTDILFRQGGSNRKIASTDTASTYSALQTYNAGIQMGSFTPTVNGQIGYNGTNLLFREGGTNKVIGTGTGSYDLIRYSIEAGLHTGTLVSGFYHVDHGAILAGTSVVGDTFTFSIPFKFVGGASGPFTPTIAVAFDPDDSPAPLPPVNIFTQVVNVPASTTVYHHWDLTATIMSLGTGPNNALVSGRSIDNAGNVSIFKPPTLVTFDTTDEIHFQIAVNVISDLDTFSYATIAKASL
jgi:hypothetical protein